MSNNIDVEILCVGTEILLGNIVNSNAKFISENLHNIGVNVFHQSVVGDNFDRVLNSLKEGFTRANVIITTGGLGPTKDDMTKEAVSAYFDAPLILFEEEKEKLENFFSKRNLTMTENNLRQAYFPEGCTILVNNNGTAPGLIMSKNDQTVIMLPGPPKEMQKMFMESVIPYLEKRSNRIFVSKTLNFIGIGESAMEDKILHLIDNQTNPTIAPYAKDFYPIIRITASGTDKDVCNSLIENTEKEILDILGDYLFGYNDDVPEDSVVKMLIEQNKTITFAESCTGGLLCGTLVNVNGSSSVLNESFITYSNEAKEKNLGVSKEILKNYGAVSNKCAIMMSRGALEKTGADIAVSVTGIAGDFSTSDKPIGLTYICLSTKDTDKVYEFRFSRSRNDNRKNAVMNALNIIIKHLRGIDYVQ